MTPEAQRIAIAEACPFVEWNGDAPFWRDARGSIIRFDPLNDLNAMHEAENAVLGLRYFETGEDNPLATVYWLSLGRLLRRQAAHLSATAAQRAEAFCRTVPSKQNSSLSIWEWNERNNANARA